MIKRSHHLTRFAVCAATVLAFAMPLRAAAQDPAECASYADEWSRLRPGDDAAAIADFLITVPRTCAALREQVGDHLRTLSSVSSRGAPSPPPPSSPAVTTTAPATDVAPAPVTGARDIAQGPASEPAPSSVSISDQLIAGEATFNKPSRMSRGETAVIEVQVNLAEQEAPSQLGTSGETVTRQVAISREVEARLLSPDFDIEPLTQSGTLAITDETVGRWAWRVTPRRSGEGLRLVLQIYGRVRLPDQEPSFALIKQYEEQIDVTVTPRDVLNQALTWSTDHWPAVSGVTGAGFAGLLFLIRRRRKKTDAV